TTGFETSGLRALVLAALLVVGRHGLVVARARGRLVLVVGLGLFRAAEHAAGRGADARALPVAAGDAADRAADEHAFRYGAAFLRRRHVLRRRRLGIEAGVHRRPAPAFVQVLGLLLGALALGRVRGLRVRRTRDAERERQRAQGGKCCFRHVD